ncbi:MAG TPA: MarR family transcriptional regulator [Streptosporangiaceae bacterium]|nr:MarR family transcriptional regulator [Streptosporangiaceae bacterium]
MARVRTKGTATADHLRLEGEAVALWFEMQARLEAHFTRLAGDHGLSAIQAKVLMQLQPTGAVTMRGLADQLHYDASNLTGVIDRLEERGAVRRQPHPQDRRIKGVVLTGEGARLRQAFWERLTGRSGPLGQLSRRELADLRDLLKGALNAPRQ